MYRNQSCIHIQAILPSFAIYYVTLFQRNCDTYWLYNILVYCTELSYGIAA